MYCSSCGVAVAQGLSYCNFCGAKLNRDNDESKSSDLRAETLVSTIAAVFILGLIAIIVLMGMMKAVLGLPVDRVLGFAFAPFVLLLIIEGVFIRLLLRRTKQSEEPRVTELSKQQVTNELDAARSRVLSEGMPSVTEHTTRAFAPINDERSSR